MRIIVTLASSEAMGQSLRAALPATDLVLLEPTVQDALDRLATTKADLLIVDDTPRLRPDDLVKLSEAHPNLPMLVISARYDTESRAAFIVAGARRFVSKPFSCEELVEAVDELAEGAGRPEPPVEVPAPVATAAPSHVKQHQSALRWMSRHAALLEDANQLANNVVDALIDVFDANRAAVLLVKSGTARVVSSEGISDAIAEPLRLPLSDGLMRWLDDNGCLFDRRHHPEAYAAQKQMGLLKARLAFPIVVEGRTRGAVLVGEKSTGGDYSNEERELLGIMTRSISSSLERSRHYRDASRQQRRVDAVLSSITTGVVTVRHDKTVSMMNEAAERLLGIRAADVLGRSVQRLGSVFADAVLKTLRTNQALARHELYLADRDLRLGISVTPAHDEGVVAIFAAIPGEKQPLGGGDDQRFWEYLSSRVAQEIKNPMVAINTFAQLLPTKYDSQGFREEFSQVVRDEVARINAVVDRLYAFARPANLNIAQVDLNAEVKEALAELEAELAGHGIEVETSFNGDVHVAVDAAMMKEAIQNVVQNSVDAMEGGGKLRVRTVRNNGWCEVLVEDTGTGVSEQDAPLIFLPFYSTKERGMGLGLTIAQRIAGQHRGQLELVQSTRKGSVFALRIPPGRSGAAEN